MTVNVVFVGFDEGDAPWKAVQRAAPLGRRADRPLARLLRDRRAARARLRLRLPAALHEPLVGGRVLLLPVVDRGRQAADRVAAGLQRAGRRPRRDQQPLDRRADGREAADRHRAAGRRHAQAHDLLHQLVRPQRLQVPRLLQDRRAGSRHRLRLRRQLATTRKIVAWGGTTPDDEETGLGRRGVNRVWFYDLSAGPEAWAGNFDITNADLDGDGVADYRIPVSWEYGQLPAEVGAARRPRQGDPLRRARPAVHDLAAVPAVLHGRPAARPRRPRRQHGRGPAGRRRLARVHQARPVPPGGARAAGRLRAQRRTTRTCRSRATSGAASTASSRSTRRRAVLVLPAVRASRRTPTCSWRPPSTSDRFLEGDGDYEAGLHQLLDRRTRRRRSATPTTTGSTARRAACSASCRPASSRPATA